MANHIMQWQSSFLQVFFGCLVASGSVSMTTLCHNNLELDLPICVLTQINHAPMRCLLLLIPVADPEGRGGLVKIIHKKDGRIDFMFIAPPPPHLGAGSATEFNFYSIH